MKSLELDVQGTIVIEAGEPKEKERGGEVRRGVQAPGYSVKTGGSIFWLTLDLRQRKGRTVSGKQGA